MQHYTTIEQSKKLLELGLNPKTADFEYQCVGFTMHTTRPTDDFKYNVMLKEQNIPHESKYDIPCWSLGALLDIIPSISNPVGINSFRVAVPSLVKEQNWVCKYDGDLPFYFSTESDTTSKVFFTGNTPVEAVCRMVCWLLENGYISRKENKI